MSKNHVWVVEIRHVELGWMPLLFSDFGYHLRFQARHAARRIRVMGGVVRVRKYVRVGK